MLEVSVPMMERLVMVMISMVISKGTFVEFPKIVIIEHVEVEVFHELIVIETKPVTKITHSNSKGLSMIVMVVMVRTMIEVI